MELINEEAAPIRIVEVKDDIMRGLVEVVVVDRLRLIHHYLLAIGVYLGHDCFFLAGQIVIVEVLILDVEDETA